MFIFFRNLALVFFIISSAITSAFAKDFYKWVDSHGSTHYTENPPVQDKNIRRIGTVKTFNSPYTESNRQDMQYDERYNLND